jgi:hypothetical protein
LVEFIVSVYRRTPRVRLNSGYSSGLLIVALVHFDFLIVNVGGVMVMLCDRLISVAVCVVSTN